ncbi:Conserved_hypothetical protein [Hexamita inflata]|uniref:Transmembrane protein n=1 Tax=Hexamita inflata TaxID=28002 RepID=A0AA86UK83_9EUKA|nr:Conserved hypothetical protein [Hexamita inflata]
MIQTLVSILCLNCFEDNTTVVLSQQSHNPIFIATMINDSSTESVICKSLLFAFFTISLDFQGFQYTYPTKQKLTRQIELQFICEDSVTNCAAAFTASSVQFDLTFVETNTVVHDVVSKFMIQKYNRLQCLIDSYISYDSNSFVIGATPTNCELQYQQNQMAVVSLFVYPDYYLKKSFSLTGISSLSQLLPLLTFNCITDFVDTDQRVCNRIIKQFQTSLTNVINCTISLPATIPNGNGLYQRQSQFSIYTQITTVTSSFASQFDCYLPFQEVVFFYTLARITFVINESAVNCIKPYDEFIGITDKIIRVIRVIGSDGNSVQFKFSGDTHNLQNTRYWLECKYDLSGEQVCLENIKTVRKMSNPIGLLSREFIFNNTVIKEVQNAIHPRGTRYESPIITLNSSHLCFSTTNVGDKNAFYQVSVTFMLGEPRFLPQHHTDNVLTTNGQIYFPSQAQYGQLDNYCFDYELQNITLYNLLRTNVKNVSALVQMMGTQLAAQDIHIIDDTVKVKYYLWFCSFMILGSGVWFYFARRYEIVRGTYY